MRAITLPLLAAALVGLLVAPVASLGGGFYGAPDVFIPRGPDGNATAPSLTEFNETVVARRIVDVYANPSWGISTRRDDVTAVGGGYVDSINGEIRVATTAAASDSLVLETVDRASYIPGNQGQVGIGLRVPVLPVDDQVARWGLFNDENGFGWGISATCLFAFYRTNGVDVEVCQSDFTVDPLDGTGPSKVSLDLADGHVWHIDFVWYGYGTINWQVVASQISQASAQLRPAHVYNPDSAVSVEDPNQPVRVEVENGAAGGAFEVRVGGRQFSLLRGARAPQVRDLHEAAYGTVLAASPAWTPIVSIRRKTTVNGRLNSIRCHYAGFAAMSGANTEYRVTYGDTVTGGTWGAPTGVALTETGIETNSTMTSVSPGDVVHRGLLAGAIGSARGATNSAERDDLPQTLAMTLWGRPIGVGTPTVDAALIDWEEEW